MKIFTKFYVIQICNFAPLMTFKVLLASNKMFSALASK